MSIAETVETREARGDGAAGPPLEPRSWITNRLGRMARAPTLTIPGPGRFKANLHTDRVRAAPAVSPGLSLQIGATACMLGVAGLCFPKTLARWLGVDISPAAMRGVFGARELWSGISLTNDPTQAGVLWARVAGDAFDIAALKTIDRPTNRRRPAVRAALGFVLLVTALDVFTAIRLSRVDRNCR